VKCLEENNGLRKLPQAIGLLMVALACLAAAPASAREKPDSTVRWMEGLPGCTFSRDDDGKYRYGLWTDDLGVIFAIDSQELQRSTRRLDPFLAILLSFHYRGTGSIDVRAHGIKLEFVSHSHVQHGAVDPESFSAEYKNLVAAAAEQDQREIKKHPQKKEQQEAVMRAATVELAEVQQFLMVHSLPPVKLDSGNREASGWVFFKARDKWIGKWKVQEEFRLRIPAGNRIFEFPFKLPPREGDLILRKRD
jgi:hypothetical protein